jgi:hypothetical protein
MYQIARVKAETACGYLSRRSNSLLLKEAHRCMYHGTLIEEQQGRSKIRTLEIYAGVHCSWGPEDGAGKTHGKVHYIMGCLYITHLRHLPGIEGGKGQGNSYRHVCGRLGSLGAFTARLGTGGTESIPYGRRRSAGGINLLWRQNFYVRA